MFRCARPRARHSARMHGSTERRASRLASIRRPPSRTSSDTDGSSRSRWDFVTRYITVDRSAPQREQSLVSRKRAPQTGHRLEDSRLPLRSSLPLH